MAELLPNSAVHDLGVLGPPEPYEDYLARGGYEAWALALKMDPQEIIAWVAEADVTGRGGAGYPAASKWGAARVHGGPRYLVVNGAEGEPGSYKDRHLMSRAPHQVVEGIAIAARAIGASEAIVYVNSDFGGAHDALVEAVAKVSDLALGKGVVPIRVHSHRHVYIAGEETAMLEVLMGRPAWPSPRPPYPTERGYLGQPTVVNNVETIAHIPLVLRHGVEWYRDRQPALYSVSGDVAEPGVFEVDKGITASGLVERAGGVSDPEGLAGLLPGGYSVPALSPSQLGVSMTQPALAKAGSGFGASVIVVGRTLGMARALAGITAFFARESCGTCPVCVMGTATIAEALRSASRADRALTEVREIATLANYYRHKGICPLLDTAAAMAGSIARLTDVELGVAEEVAGQATLAR